MKNIIRYGIIRLLSKDTNTAMKVYEFLFSNKTETEKNKVLVKEEVIEKKGEKSKNKKDDLMESLSYLKNKKVKTKQDKESIYTLEMILKNMK
jgi:hypothetical protein